jgi:SAM-dependent methyltransferase
VSDRDPGAAPPLSADARLNRERWDARADDYQRTSGPQLDHRPLCWGVWAIPEASLGALGEVAGQDVLELGCGGAQWSVFLAQAGARVTGVDNSAAQLAHARRFVAAHGVAVTLIHAPAEAVPLPAASFDLVMSDHGALTFSDPERTLPEVARLLRPGGHLVFNTSSPLAELCWDPAERQMTPLLQGNHFELGRQVDEDGVGWTLTHSRWIALLSRCGFVVERLEELRPPASAQTAYASWNLEWSRRWPSEDLWRVRREGR